MVSEYIRNLILNNPGISESDKAQYLPTSSSSSSGGGGGGSSSSSLSNVPDVLGGTQSTTPSFLPTSPTTTSSESSSSNYYSTPSQQYQQTSQFTGKVKESFKGTPQQETFYSQGKETGRIKYDKGVAYAQVTTPSRFKFNQTRGDTFTKKTYELSDEGISYNEESYMIDKEISKPTLSTREEIFAEGSRGVFLTAKEMKEMNITTSILEGGTQSASQKTINFVEYLIGKEVGSSKTGYIPLKSSNQNILKSSGATYTKLKQDFSTKYPKTSKLISGEYTNIEKMTGTKLQTGYVPITPITTGIPNIKFLGVSQRLKDKKYFTTIKFEETLTKQKGIAQSVSQVKNLEKDIQLTRTITRGATFKKGIKFPSSKFTIKSPIQFSGKQQSISQVIKKPIKINELKGINILKNTKVTEENSLGIVKIAKGKKITSDKYLGVGQSINKKGLSFVRAVSYSPKTKYAKSSGIIKELKQARFGSYFSSGTKLKYDTGTKAVSDTKQIISRSLTKQTPKKATASSIFSIKNPSPTTVIKVINKQTPSLKVKQQQTLLLKVKQQQIPLTKIKTKQLSSSKLKQNTKQLLKETSLTKQQQVNINKLIPIQKQITKVRQIPILKTNYFFRGYYSYIPKFSITKTPLSIKYKEIKPIKNNERNLLKSSDIKVISQGFTSKALGLKKLRVV